MLLYFVFVLKILFFFSFFHVFILFSKIVQLDREIYVKQITRNNPYAMNGIPLRAKSSLLLYTIRGISRKTVVRIVKVEGANN